MDFTEAYADTCSSVGMAAQMGDLGLVQDLVWHGTYYVFPYCYSTQFFYIITSNLL